MYICIVPVPLYIQDGTTITGRLGNPGLPDYMLWEQVPSAKPNLLDAIGDNIVIGTIPQQRPLIYKVYGIWNNVLHEYNVATLPESDIVFPISVKRYADSFTTTLYVQGIAKFKQYARLGCDLDTDVLSLPRFLRCLMGNQPSFQFQIPPPHFTEEFLTQESPYTVSNFLKELGFECLNYTESAAAYMMYNYGKDLAVIRDIFEMRPKDDLITLYGCSGTTSINKSLLYKYVEPGSNEFYNTIATDQANRNQNFFNLQYLDQTSHWYNDLEIEEIVEQLFQLRNTDYNAIIQSNMVNVDRSMLLGYHPIDDCSDCWDIIRDNLAAYNRKAPDPILRINVCKTWLDEVFFSIATLSGNVENLYLNLALFHLYTSSIIRRRVSS